MINRRLLVPIVSLLIIITFPSNSATAQEEPQEKMIKIETSMGDMVIKLYNETPGHRDNIIKLIHEGFYDDQLFHRVIKDFMIQGGDPHSTDAEKGQRLGLGGPGYEIPAEFNQNLIHKKGALAAAREGDSSNPEQASSGSQFYLVLGRVLTPEEINILTQRGVATFTEESTEIYTTLGGTPHLDGAYTVFGEIVMGFDVLDAIASQPVDAYNRPLQDVIYSITIIN